MTLFVLEPSIIFSVLCNYIAIVTVIYDVMLTLTLGPKIKNKSKNKNKPSLMFTILIIIKKDSFSHSYQLLVFNSVNSSECSINS